MAIAFATWLLLSAAPDSAATIGTWSFEDQPESPGVAGHALICDGFSTVLSVPDTAALRVSAGDFALSVWAAPYRVGGEKQAIVAKSVYARNLREWTLLLDDDSRFRFYLRAAGQWQTVASAVEPQPGQWYHLAVVRRGEALTIYVDGQPGESITIDGQAEAPGAPLTFGAVDNGGSLQQAYFGAIDEARLDARAWTAGEVAMLADHNPPDHVVPEPPTIDRYPLWAGDFPPKESELPRLEGVRYEMIKRREPEVDGYDWLHGVALIFWQGELLASFGHNQGRENTPTEVLNLVRSRDGGRTWGALEPLAPGGDGFGNSHAVFFECDGELWCFAPRFGKGPKVQFPGLQMEAWRLRDDQTWDRLGVVAEDIWPLGPPMKLANGNWLVTGCNARWRAAVAVSHGDDLLHWDNVDIPVGDRVLTEATAWVDGARVTLIMRNQSPLAMPNCAALSFSDDGGRTWSEPVESNFPMVTCKPFASKLSNGQRYLIANVCDVSQHNRRTLAIAVSKPGEEQLSRIWLLATGDRSLAYPYAIERNGELWIGYSEADGKLGGNRNHARLAVVPVSALAAD